VTYEESWAPNHMGPPGGPEDAWGVYNGTLYLNYLPKVRFQWFQNIEKNIAVGNKRWSSWWGKVKTGPFNTDCMAETWSVRDCDKDPQPIPPV